MFKRTRQILILALLGILVFALGKSIYIAGAVETKCVFCCSSNCDGANGGVVPTASPTPTPTSTPTPTPAALFSDTFTDSNGTALPSHTPDTGSGWTEVADTLGTLVLEIQSNTAKPSGQGTDARLVYIAEPAINSADMETTVKVTARPSGVVNEIILLLVRYQDLNNFYACAFDSFDGGLTYSYRVVDGVTFDVGIAVTSGLATNDTIGCRISGTTLSTLRNGNVINSSVVSGITTAGNGGIYLGNLPGFWTGPDVGSAWQLDDFVAQAYVPPSPPPSPPASQATVDMACSTYGIANRDVASGADLTTADTIRDTCRVVLTWWRQTTAQNWCPYILDGNQEVAEYCGPYQNWGFMNGGSISMTDNLGTMMYHYGGFFSSCSADNGNGANRDCGLILRDDDAAVPVQNAWGNPDEKLTDKGSYGDSTKYIDRWWAFFIDVPDTPSQLAPWTGTAATNLWNMTFADNYQIWLQHFGGWSDTPIDPRRGGSYIRSNMEIDAIAGAQHLRDLADAAGKSLFCNLDGDADYDYFNRGTTYRTWVSKCHFALLEQQGVGFDGQYVTEANWLRRINVFQDIAQNTNTIPVIDATNLGGQGNLWYHTAGMLLAKEPGKGMIYFQSNIPSGANLTKLKNLDCGNPKIPAGRSDSNFFLVTNSYYKREWDSCLILVNPKTVATSSISLGGNYTNVETGGTVSSITLQPHTGVILTPQ